MAGLAGQTPHMIRWGEVKSAAALDAFFDASHDQMELKQSAAALDAFDDDDDDDDDTRGACLVAFTTLSGNACLTALIKSSGQALAQLPLPSYFGDLPHWPEAKEVACNMTMTVDAALLSSKI
eukprot:scaffold169334_cov18-Tisochrysis_lutea.AAC.2